MHTVLQRGPRNPSPTRGSCEDAGVPPIVLITGAAAVGKTTTARALAGAFPRSIHLPVDDVRHMVVGGMAWPGPDWHDALIEQVALARGAVIRTAGDYAAAGFSVVIDDFFDPLGMREYRSMLTGPETIAVLLHPSEAVARRRNAERNGGVPNPMDERAIGHAYGFLGPALDELTADGWLVLDTTDLDVQATVEAILDRLGLDRSSDVGPKDQGSLAPAPIG